MKDADDSLESPSLSLERRRLNIDLLKWIVVAIGAVVSFLVIDMGKLELEKTKAEGELQQKLLSAYLQATETPNPDIWKRKLDVIYTLAPNDELKDWATKQIKAIDDSLALNTLYKETVITASRLVANPDTSSPEWKADRIRFEQFYWAELPFAGESEEVANAMKYFRNALIAAENSKFNDLSTERLTTTLHKLAFKFRSDIESRKSSESPDP